MRSCRGGHATDKVQTMMPTDVMILATIRRPPPATHHMPHAARQTLPTIRHLLHTSQYLASATQEVSGSSIQQRTWEHIVKRDWDCIPS